MPQRLALEALPLNYLRGRPRASPICLALLFLLGLAPVTCCSLMHRTHSGSDALAFSSASTSSAINNMIACISSGLASSVLQVAISCAATLSRNGVDCIPLITRRVDTTCPSESGPCPHGLKLSLNILTSRKVSSLSIMLTTR